MKQGSVPYDPNRHLSVNLLTAAMVAAPVLLILRGKKALAELRHAFHPSAPDPPLPQA